jgi:hypothetical protein
MAKKKIIKNIATYVPTAFPFTAVKILLVSSGFLFFIYVLNKYEIKLSVKLRKENENVKRVKIN